MFREVSAVAEQLKLATLLQDCQKTRSAILDTLPAAGLARKETDTSTPSAETSTVVINPVRTLVEEMNASLAATGSSEPLQDLATTCQMFLPKLKLSSQQVRALEYRTRGQADNDQWHLQRYGRLTASMFGKVTKRVASMTTLVKHLLYNPAPPSHLPALKYGREHESDARMAYLAYHLDGGSHVTVKQSGLLLSEDGHLGCSPDGLVYDYSTQEQGLLEIKCPMSAESSPLVDVARKSSHFCASVVDGSLLRLKKSHDYYKQVMGGMAINRVKWCDFVLWTPLEISVERIQFDEEEWKQMRERLDRFYRHWLLPEILQPKHPGSAIKECHYDCDE